MTRVLFAYDGSAQARRALGYAERLRPDDDVSVISVAPVLIEGPRTEEYTDPADDPVKHREQAEEAREILAELGTEAEAIATVGNPAAEILTAAETFGAELIVVGRRGRHVAERFLMGSVSDRVVRHAACDVLVVR